jgi:hypothetical protein
VSGIADRSGAGRAGAKGKPTRHEWRLRLVLVLGGFAASFLALELSLRLTHTLLARIALSKLPPPDQRIFVPSANPRLIYELRPGGQKIDFRVNADGMVGGPVEREKAPGVFRVGVGGDSISCGFELNTPGFSGGSIS